MSAAGIAFDTVRQSAGFVRRQPRFTAVVVLALGVGIGANTALFAVVEALLLRPLPYERAHELVELDLPTRRPPLAEIGSAQSFTGVAAYLPWGFHVVEPGGVANAFAFRVSPNLFEVLGVRAALGRVFSPSDAGNVVVLSHHYWQRLSGDTQMLGGTLTIAGQPHTIVGVLAPDFVLWFRDANFFVPDTPENGRLVGRLKPGVTSAQALAEIEGILASASALAGGERTSPQVRPFSEAFRSSDATTILMLQATVGMVLLMTCANISNLLLVRASARQREFAIRTAIGAGRARLFGQLVCESLLVASMGAVAGLVLASWSLEVLGTLLPAGISRSLRGAEALSINVTVVAFTAGVAAATVLLVGLAPAVVALRTDIVSALRHASKGTTPRRQRVGRALVVLEIALALTLLIGSALIFKSLVGLENRYLGFNADRVLRATIDLQPYKHTPEQRVAMVSGIVSRCKELPGVESVGVLAPQLFPFGGPRVRGATFIIDGRAGAMPRAETYVVNADYFDALGIPLRKGRVFTEADTASSLPVAVLSEVVAKRYWGSSDPIGSVIQLGAEDPAAPRVTVIGVVGDVRNPIGADVQPTAYRPYAQSPTRAAVLMIRTAIDADQLTNRVRDMLTDTLRGGAPVRVSNLQRSVVAYISPQRFTTAVVGFFAVLGLLLAGLGVYGVMRHWVSVRTFEFGVRAALGAERGDIARLVLRSAGMSAAIGVALGIGGALALQRIIASQLYGVSPTDPLVFAGVSVFMAAVAMTAALLPARAAMRVDAAVVLRQE